MELSPAVSSSLSSTLTPNAWQVGLLLRGTRHVSLTDALFPSVGSSGIQLCRLNLPSEWEFVLFRNPSIFYKGFGEETPILDSNWRDGAGK